MQTTTINGTLAREWSAMDAESLRRLYAARLARNCYRERPASALRDLRSAILSAEDREGRGD